MKFIKLSQRVTVERQGKYGWVPETVYEPVFVAADHIASMYFAGLTILKMTSGERRRAVDQRAEVPEVGESV